MKSIIMMAMIADSLAFAVVIRSSGLDARNLWGKVMASVERLLECP